MLEVKRKIALLVVEDDVSMLNIIVKSLKALNLDNIDFLFYTTSSLRQEKKLLKNTFIDLIIQDVILPDGNGIHFLLKRDFEFINKSVKVLFLTDQTDCTTREKSLLFGKSDYLSKPFYPKELNLRILKLLGLGDSNRQYIYEKVKDLEYVKFSLDEKCLLVNGIKIFLTQMEAELISYLIDQDCPINLTILTKGFELNGKQKCTKVNLQVLISRTRAKLKRVCGYTLIQNKRGVGYYIG